MHKDWAVLLTLLGAVLAWAWAWLALVDRLLAAGCARWAAHVLGASRGLGAGAGAFFVGAAGLMPAAGNDGGALAASAAAGVLLLGAYVIGFWWHDRRAAARGRAVPGWRLVLPRPAALREAVGAWWQREKQAHRARQQEGKARFAEWQQGNAALRIKRQQECKGQREWEEQERQGEHEKAREQRRAERLQALGMPFGRFFELRQEAHMEAWLLALPWICAESVLLLTGGLAPDWSMGWLAALIQLLVMVLLGAFLALLVGLAMLVLALITPWLLRALLWPLALVSVFIESRGRIGLRRPWVEEAEPWEAPDCNGDSGSPCAPNARSDDGDCWKWLALLGFLWWLGS